MWELESKWIHWRRWHNPKQQCDPMSGPKGKRQKWMSLVVIGVTPDLAINKLMQCETVNRC